jgi:hypothetical protein
MSKWSLEAGKFIAFRADRANTSPVTINGKVLNLKTKDGKSLKAGDITPGDVIKFNPFTGELLSITKGGEK